MASGGFSTDIHDHGVSVVGRKNKVQCLYCGKVVSGFYRLKCHLGAIRGDVLPCEHVPTTVKEFFRHKIIAQKAEKFSSEVGETAMCQTGGPQSRADTCIGSASISSATGESQAEVVRRSVAQFFYEAGIDFSCVNITSFRRMLTTTLGQQFNDCQLLFPTSEELEGNMLKNMLRTVQEKVSKIRNSWVQSGCSILLDEWDTCESRHMVNFLVDCSEGPLYLQSADISSMDSIALQLLLDNVIQEAGLQNVVQIIASYGSWMWPTIKQTVGQNRSIFQAVSASDCINQILLQITETMPDIKAVTGMANDLFTFLYRDTAFSEMFGGFSHDESLIKLWKFSAAEPFLMLENILLKRGSLEGMVYSSEWNNFGLSKTMDGQRASELIKDSSFWTQAKRANKATSALLHALDLIVSRDKPFLGFIYETMDQVKERIRSEFEEDESVFMPFWDLIDDVWNNHLHCPLHAAAYYLNPRFFYSEDFNLDDEVNDGLMCCIIRMVQDQPTKNLVLEQFQSYKNGHGPFKRGMAENVINNVDPVSWWVKYGKDFPELQRFSIRILSQACDGARKYGLRRSMAEKLLTEGGSLVEQERFQDLTFVHYNLQLWRSESR